MIAELLQEAIYKRLNGNAALKKIITAIYDEIPQELDEPESKGKYPFVVIGDDQIDPWDTDSQDGFECTVTIHVWSRYRGKKEAQNIQKHIYSAIHNKPLSIPGYQVLEPTQTAQDVQPEDNNTVRHGTQVFKIYALHDIKKHACLSEATYQPAPAKRRLVISHSLILRN